MTRLSLDKLFRPALLWSEDLLIVIIIVLGVQSVEGPKGGGQSWSLFLTSCCLNLRPPLAVSRCVLFTLPLALSVSQ